MPHRRNYRKEYDEYHGKPEQRARRVQRTLARRKAIKEGRVAKGDGKEIHHEGASRKGKLPSYSSTKVLSKSANRKKQPKRS